MNILIIFGTVEGQTGKIAGFAEARARAQGHRVRCVDAAGLAVPLSFDDVDRVILAASVHERRHPKPFETLVASHRDALDRCPTLMLSVSLSAAFPEGMEDAQDYLTEMEMRTGFTPGREALVAGAVQPGSYDYFERNVLRFVVLKDRNYDPRHGAHEFTDWAALGAEVDRFLSVHGSKNARQQTDA